MQYVSLGSTGLQVSRLGFGGIPVQRIDQPRTRQLLELSLIHISEPTRRS